LVAGTSVEAGGCEATGAGVSVGGSVGTTTTSVAGIDVGCGAAVGSSPPAPTLQARLTANKNIINKKSERYCLIKSSLQ
jgi:hypothetical protein